MKQTSLIWTTEIDHIEHNILDPHPVGCPLYCVQLVYYVEKNWIMVIQVHGETARME